MRIVVTARQTLIPGYERILGRLVSILGVISKNPSNPFFDQYIFESLSGLMRSDRFVLRILVYDIYNLLLIQICRGGRSCVHANF